MFIKFRVFDGEYIVKISRGVVKHVFKADMKSYKPLETAAIFFSSEAFLKQGIS